MNIPESTRFALRGVLANKLRSLLTMSGIIIGVAAVIILIAAGNGASAAVQQSISALGSNTHHDHADLHRRGQPRARRRPGAAPGGGGALGGLLGGGQAQGGDVGRLARPGAAADRRYRGQTARAPARTAAHPRRRRGAARWTRVGRPGRRVSAAPVADRVRT